MARNWKNLAVGAIFLILIALAVVMMIKPRQAQVTDEILETRGTDEYLNFIVDNLVGGGPPKDGIPAVDDPKYITPEEAEAEGLTDDELIFGVNYGGSQLYGTPSTNFDAIVGDIMLTQEHLPSGATGLYRLRWTGESLLAEMFPLTEGSPYPSQWEHVTFAGAGIREVP